MTIAFAPEMQLPCVDTEKWSAEDVLRWGFEQFGPRIALASAFGAEGMALIDLASRVRANFRIFTLDTGFFFPETYELIDEVERRYGIRVERCHPELDAAAQARAYGDALWSRNPDRCCELRKVRPLREKLKGLDAWIAAIRRDQTPDRAETPKIGWDAKFGLMKLNPLADWNSEQVWSYLKAHHIPTNRLYNLGYASIGCTHCTRAVQPGESSRAGRWPGFEKTECGLHAKQRTPSLRPELTTVTGGSQ
ncbi:MAG TPA: phosphoadenylyl-sulfate reductase [Terriglobia bacterium]|nr:phosphoadenylyl-sulfate reductase [Terriglobia bacterium]